MSKQLLVMRHAKSSWSDPAMKDFDRPLNKRGLRVTPEVAKFVHLQGLTPDLIISSPAKRARMTSEIFVEHCGGVSKEQLVFNDDFYHAPFTVYQEALEQFKNEEVNILMFVGHNPGMEDLVEDFGDQWQTMPTAAVAHFDLGKTEWSEIWEPFEELTLKNLWRPKEINIR
jgi:phosphohistidine phosphatase